MFGYVFLTFFFNYTVLKALHVFLQFHFANENG